MKQAGTPTSTSKGKRKAVAPASDDDSDDDGMAVDFNVDMQDNDEEEGSSVNSADKDDGVDEGAKIVPMPESGSISALREKLHARMATLRRGGKSGGDGEAGDRDELLEERRRQRAALRERRRKETKEKIRREEEAKGRKGKGKEKDSRAQGHQTKVCFGPLLYSNFGVIGLDLIGYVIRRNYLYQIDHLHPPPTPTSHSQLWRVPPQLERKYSS
jgi:hypothetical protein